MQQRGGTVAHLSRFCLISLLLVFAPDAGRAHEAIRKISLPLIPDLQRADIYVLKMMEYPSAALVLCPGCNSNGKEWVESPEWKKFAQSQNLALVGLSFASEVDLLNRGKGYYYARQGSGQLLLDGLSQVFPENMPLIFYGVSGGAHFTARFVEWKPDHVISWCAYSAGWWDKPVALKNHPPGLIVCGEDDPRLGASLIYFKQGRVLGEPWLWVCVPKIGHSISPPAEDFVRSYFSSVLNGDRKSGPGAWVDIDLKTEIEKMAADAQPSLSGWLPDAALFAEWQRIQ